MNKDRLLRLATRLEQNAKNPKGVKFDLNSWGVSEDNTRRLDCGTQACAVGFAAICGEFQAEGLTIDMWWATRDRPTIRPMYKGYEDWQAVRMFFNLSTDQAWYLFSPDDYHGPIEGAVAELAVVKRIREFVGGKGGPRG